MTAWTEGEGARVPFTFPAGGTFSHPGWPPNVRVPEREEVRQLAHRELLKADRSVVRDWVVFPTTAALEAVGNAGRNERTALADPEERLALVLQATVDAHQSDPSQPLYLNENDHADLVMDSRWRLHPEAVKFHDLSQLEDLGLISTRASGEGAIQFWPTSWGRRTVNDPAGVLEETAAKAQDPEVASRFRGWAERLRVGDIAVGASGGGVVQVIRALLEAAT